MSEERVLKTFIRNHRIELACKLISMAIRVMPEDWQDRKSIDNLMMINEIKTK